MWMLHLRGCLHCAPDALPLWGSVTAWTPSCSGPPGPSLASSSCATPLTHSLRLKDASQRPFQCHPALLTHTPHPGLPFPVFIPTWLTISIGSGQCAEQPGNCIVSCKLWGRVSAVIRRNGKLQKNKFPRETWRFFKARWLWSGIWKVNFKHQVKSVLSLERGK